MLVAFLVPVTATAQEATKHENQNGYDITTKSSDGNISNEQDNQTTQENVGIVQQSAVYAVGQASTYSIDRVSCPSPSIVISGGYSGNSHGSGSVSLSTSAVFPIGGRNSRICTNALEARMTNFILQNEVNVAKECSALLAAKINLSPESFPTLSKMCEGVTTNITVVEITTPVIQLPEKETTPQESPPGMTVRGRW